MVWFPIGQLHIAPSSLQTYNPKLPANRKVEQNEQGSVVGTLFSWCAKFPICMDFEIQVMLKNKRPPPTSSFRGFIYSSSSRLYHSILLWMQLEPVLFAFSVCAVISLLQSLSCSMTAVSATAENCTQWLTQKTKSPWTIKCCSMNSCSQHFSLDCQLYQSFPDCLEIHIHVQIFFKKTHTHAHISE